MSEQSTNYRLDHAEKRSDVAYARMSRIEEKLDRVLESMAKLPTVGSLWTMVATVLGLSVGVVALMVGVLTWTQGLHLGH